MCASQVVPDGRSDRPLVSGGPPGGRFHSALSFDETACLGLRSRYSNCDACVMTCPAGVLRFADSGLVLEAECLGCGRCAAACPTGALWVKDYAAVAVRPEHEAGAVRIDCWKVPARESGPDAARFPCLGSLSVSRLLELWRLAGERDLILNDRGWCRRCTAGAGAIHPAADALDEANRLLVEVGVPPERLPRFEFRPLPPRSMPARIPDPVGERPVFGSLAQQIMSATRDAAVSTGPTGRHGVRGTPLRVGAAERTRVMSQLAAVCEKTRGRLPSRLFPALEISEACSHHEVCAAVCPSGALRTYETEDGGERGIVFDAILCLACGDCERVCPGREIRLLPEGDGTGRRAPRRLTSFARRECYYGPGDKPSDLPAAPEAKLAGGTETETMR